MMQLHYVDVIDSDRVSERFTCAVIGPLRLTGLVHDQYRFDIQNGGAVAWPGCDTTCAVPVLFFTERLTA